MKRRISFIFAFALLCMSSVVAQGASGTCGDNLTWVLTEEGELIIEGTGEITSNPWRDFKGTITKVTLSAGVTGTKSYAFEGCSSLTTVNIPENSQLINIETAMFQNCSSLASITIPMSVTSIGYYAFDGCSSLASISIPKSVAEIANYAFRNCGGLTSITIKSTTPPTIGYYSFVGVDMSVYVPKGSVAAYKEAEHWSEFANIQAIVSLVASGTCGDKLTWTLTDDGKLTIEGTGEMYGYGWSDSPLYSHREFITEVVIPEGVTNIGEGVFWDCTGLTEVTIPAGVTSIDNYAFAGCRNLVAVPVPESVKSIGVYAFQNCNSLTIIKIPEGVTSILNNAFQDCNSLASITIPASVTSICSHAFWGCSGLTSIICNAATPPAIADLWTINDVDRSIPIYVPAASVEAYKAAEYWSEFANIQPIVIDSGTCGDDLTWKYIDGGELVIEGTGTMTDKPWENYKGSITKVTIKEGVTSIVDWAFYQCSNLTEVSIAESVTRIGGDAFRECRMLEEIALPEGLTELGTGVFLYCSALKSINVPEGVTKIGSDTFEFCPQLSSITFPSGLTEIGPWALKGAYNLASITCKAVTPPSLGIEVFSGVNTEISIYVPAFSVEAYKAASGWNLFVNVQPIILASGTCGNGLAWKLTDDGKLTIEGAGAMNNYGWSDSPLYSYRELITEVVIPEGVTNIGEGVFWDCTGLTEVIIPDGVTSIENYAFAGCRNLVSVTVPESVTSIGAYAFQSCESLTTINIPDGVTSIMNNTFQDCNSLASITIPAGVTSIGSHAFWGCSGLTSITCNATTPPVIADQWTINDVDRSIPVYVPVASIVTYEEAEYWYEFEIVGIGTETGIDNSEIKNQNSEIIHDLQGRRVQEPAKGLCIVNGRKVLVK